MRSTSRIIARKAFDAALGRKLHEVIQETQKMASQIQQSSDLWDLEHYLTQRRKEIDRKYDYGVVTLSNPSHVDITSDRAYVVIPANYTFKQKEKPVSELGSIITLTLQESPTGWRNTGWSRAKH